MLASPTYAGFADPVLNSQKVFRALMMALARPGTIEPIETGIAPPPPLSPESAAVVLALCDHETALWLDPTLASSADVSAFLRFHTGAEITAEPQEAAFALVSDWRRLLPLSRFGQGTDEYPDRSTTLVISVERITGDAGLALSGPGIAESAHVLIEPSPPDLVNQLAENRARFPRGVDLIFTCPGKVAALPRSTRIREA